MFLFQNCAFNLFYAHLDFINFGYQDSRLLGEIHVALLRLIIKDIEDVARTPSTGLGFNQNGAANPGGGHPQIVEGVISALCMLPPVLLLILLLFPNCSSNLFSFMCVQAYAWGFDIRNWQQHLNLLTWPEIFRQLALSAGFGPQLKKRSISWSYLPDNDEVAFLIFSIFLLFRGHYS